MGFSRIISAALAFQVGRRQYPQEVQKLELYDDILKDLRNRCVILYDTITKRGWLLDAERAALQIVLHRCKDKGIGNAPDLGLSREQDNVPKVMKRLGNLKLWDALDAETHEEREIFFTSEVKAVRETLVKLGIKAQAEYQRLSSNLIPGPNHTLVGFQYTGAVVHPHNLDPLTVDLESSCGSWPRIAQRELAATILFGRNFQEIFVSNEDPDLCRKFHKMPAGKDYLAVESCFALRIMGNTPLLITGAKSLSSACPNSISEAEHCPCNIALHAVEIRSGDGHKKPPYLNLETGAILIGRPSISTMLSRLTPERKPTIIS